MSERPAQSLRELRRRQIITVARQLIAERGLNALTFASLEKALDFSRGVITYHFKNKDELLSTILLSAVDEINNTARSAIEAETGMAEKLQGMLNAVVQGFLARPEAGVILIAFWSRIPADPKIAKINAELYRSWRRYSTELVEQGQAQGAFKEAPPEALGVHLVGVVIGLVTQIYFDPEAFDVEQATREAGATILARLQG